MTVKELIEELQKVEDPNLPVLVYNEYKAIVEVRTVQRAYSDIERTYDSSNKLTGMKISRLGVWIHSDPFIY